MIISPQAVIGAAKLLQSHPRFKVGFISLAGCGFIKYVLWNLYLYWRQQKRNADRGRKANERKQLIKQQCADGDPEKILSLTIDAMIKDLKNGTLTAEEVLKAFQKKALALDEKINAITEPVMEAWDQAKALDKGNDKDGLLYGVPVSIKENIGLSGYDCTGGMGYFVDKILEDDAVIVKVLRRHGAIPFIRTNIPQTMMSFCSSNNIYGETSNPLDVSRGPGGSSSGEGAMIGGGASFIGFGTDIGGSIRVPAAFCGCYSLKTTYRRTSFKGILFLSGGNLAIQPTLCPIAKDMKCLTLLSKVAMSQELYDMDPSLPCLPFNEEIMNQKGPMRIGYYVFDGNVKCQPAVVRAVQEAKSALEKRGHTLVPIEISSMSPPGFNFSQNYVKVMTADRFQNYSKNILAHEKLEKSMRLPLMLSKMPVSLIKLLSFLLSFKDKFQSNSFLAIVGFKSVLEYMDHIKALRKWKEKFMESWVEKQLDAVICPVYPSIAPKKDTMHLCTTAGVYCAMYNLLDYPSGVLPVTKVNQQDIKNTLDPNHYKATLKIEKTLMKGVKESGGLPVGVQCVALPFKEEVCLRVMKEVEAGLKIQD